MMAVLQFYNGWTKYNFENLRALSITVNRLPHTHSSIGFRVFEKVQNM